MMSNSLTIFIYIKTCLMYKILKKQFLDKPQPVSLKNLQGVKFIWKRRQYDVIIVMTSWRHLSACFLFKNDFSLWVRQYQLQVGYQISLLQYPLRSLLSSADSSVHLKPPRYLRSVYLWVMRSDLCIR